MRILKMYLCLGLSTLSLTGCATTLGSVEVWRSPQGCSPQAEKAGAQWLSSAEVTMGSVSGGQFAVVGESTKPPAVDERSRYLRVNMGMRPSSGYRLVLLSDRLEISEGVARLQLDWVAPPPDALTAQVLSYPCLNLRLLPGDYTTVEVVDGAGELRHRLSVPLEAADR